MQAPVYTASDDPGAVLDLFDQVLADLVRDSLPVIMPVGQGLLAGIAIIVIVIKGVRLALSGGIQPGELIEFLLLLTIPYTMIHYYNTPMMGSMTFPQVIISQGTWLQDVFSSNSIGNTFSLFMRAVETAWTRMMASFESLDFWTILGTGVDFFIHTFAAIFLTYLTLLMFIIVWLLTTAQVLLATIFLGIYVLLGPLFIPSMLFSPLAFFFWNWLRGLFQYSLYGAIAGAIQAVFTGVGNAYLNKLISSDFTVAELFSWTLVSMLIFSVGLLAALKVGEVAAAIVSGGGGASTGGMLTSAATTAATAGGSLAGRGAAGGLKGVG